MTHQKHHEVSEKKDDKEKETNESTKKIVTDSQNLKDNKHVVEQKNNNVEAKHTLKSLFGDLTIDCKPAAKLRSEEETKKINDLAQDIQDNRYEFAAHIPWDQLQRRMSELDPEQRQAVLETVSQRTSHEEIKSQEWKDNQRKLYGDNAVIYSSHEMHLANLLIETSENKEPRFKVEGMENLPGVMDTQTIDAVRLNEEHKAGLDDRFQNDMPYWMAQYYNWSVGPAQMQTKNIDELKADPRYAEQLKDANPYSTEGANLLIAAYFDREAARLNNGEYAAGKIDRPRDASPKEAKRFEDLQRRWDEAKNGCNPDEMRKILIETYNSGEGSRQVAAVESIRTGYDVEPVVKTATVVPSLQAANRAA